MPDLDALATDFGRLFLRLRRLLDRRMGRSGASLARTKLLMYLDRDGPTRATDIAELFGLAPRTVTEALDALERDGLVRREADPSDRRVKRISITAGGRQAVAATEPLRLKLVERIFGSLAPDEREALARIVDRLSGAIAAEEAIEIEEEQALCRRSDS